MRISLRLYNDAVLIPTSSRVERDGFFVTGTPIDSVPVEQTERLRRAIVAAIERGVPPITRDQARALLNSKDDPHLKATGARSWFTLDRQTVGLWSLLKRNGLYEIRVNQPMETHGWHEDESKKIQFPPGTALENVIDHLIAMIQECARQ